MAKWSGEYFLDVEFHLNNFIRCHVLNTLLILFETVSILKRPRTPPATPGIVDYQNADHDQLMKRLRPVHSVEEVILFDFCSIKMFIHIFHDA